MADFCLGLDLGQAQDYSAFCIVQRVLPVPDPRSDNQLPKPTYLCRGLKRWSLGTSYVSIVSEVVSTVNRQPLAGADLVVDATGVGRPILDMIRQQPLAARVVPVTITSGHVEKFVEGSFHLAKVILVHATVSLLQQRRVQVPVELQHAAVLIDELKNYRVKISQAANETFNAREGAHDDLLIAFCLACWWLERNPASSPEADMISFSDAERLSVRPRNLF